MIKPIFVVLFAGFLVLQSTAIRTIRTKLSNLESRDIIDEAEEKLGELKDIVVGAISVAEHSLGTAESDFLSYGEEIRQTGELAVQQEYESIMDKLTVAKNLGLAAGVDTFPCTTVRDEALGEWATRYAGNIRPCIVSKNTQSNQVLQDARYYVDVYINKVNDLEFQLGLCATDSTLCISPIVTQIESGMVQLPQEIQIEVDQVTEFLENLKTSLQQCSDTPVSEFAYNGNALLGNIVDCINQLIP